MLYHRRQVSKEPSSAIAPSSPLVIVSVFLVGVGSAAFFGTPDARPLPSPDESGDVAAGRVLFTRYCALCHGPNGEGYAADFAPAVTNEEFLRIASDEYLTRSILDGRSGTPMSAFGERYGGPLSEGDVEQIVTFLRSHQEAPAIRLIDAPVYGDPQRGRTIYRERCTECHKDDHRDATAPRITHPEFLALASDAYLTRSIRVGRPGTPMVAWGDELRPDQVMDLVAALRSFDPRPRAEPGQDPDVAADHHDDHDHDHGHRHEVEPPVLDLWDSIEDSDLPVGRAGAPGPAFELTGRWYVSARQLRTALTARQRMILLDARPLSDWLVGHLPGALPVPFYADHETLDRIPTDGTWVVVYCGCPHTAADRVASRLRQRGVTALAVLDEGYWHWKDSAYPIVVGDTRY